MWFEKRAHHRGWRPIAWQGWLIYACALTAVIVSSALIDDVVWFIVALVGIVSSFGLVSWFFSHR